MAERSKWPKRKSGNNEAAQKQSKSMKQSLKYLFSPTTECLHVYIFPISEKEKLASKGFSDILISSLASNLFIKKKL